MTKAILISIRPEHVINILQGKKTLELRKTAPKGFKGWVYIYVTKTGSNLIYNTYNCERYILEPGKRLNYDLNGKVVARFWYDESLDIYINDELNICTWDLSTEQLMQKACVSYDTLHDYFMLTTGDIKGVVWVIKDLEIFDTPKLLVEFFDINASKDVPFPIRLKRPPQSWQFVHVKE